jgi:DNA polymerase III subunit delta
VSKSAYVLSGEEFLVEEALNQLREEVGADPLSEMTFGSRPQVHEVIGALETPSLLGGKRLVVVNDASDLLKEMVEALTRYLESPSDDSVLVLIAPTRTKLDAVVKKTGEIVSLDAPKGRRLATWIRSRASAHSIKVDDRAAWSLIDAVGGDLRELDGALSQLATALGRGARVGAEDVRKAFTRLADQRIYAFTDAVGDRRLGVAMTNLTRLLDQGEPPLVVFGSLTSLVRNMLRAHRYADSGGARAVGDALGLPTWRAERLTKQARAYREDELTQAMALLAETDVELKGGDLPPEAALERAVVRIVSGAPS